jgi:ribonuclease HIII
MDWSMTHLTQIPTRLKNLHPHVTHIIDAQIYNGLQEFQWKMNLLLLAFHLMCKIPLMLAQADHLTPL